MIKWCIIIYLLLGATFASKSTEEFNSEIDEFNELIDKLTFAFEKVYLKRIEKLEKDEKAKILFATDDKEVEEIKTKGLFSNSGSGLISIQTPSVQTATTAASLPILSQLSINPGLLPIFNQQNKYQYQVVTGGIPALTSTTTVPSLATTLAPGQPFVIIQKPSLFNRG
jgi:hypothetical protein